MESTSAPTSTPQFSEFSSTFVASLRSVGTACTLAAVGVYLHRQGYVVGDGKRSLALISQQVTIPLFLFTKLINCNQDWSDQPCPDVTKSLSDVWILVLWPAYVVLVGLGVGWFATKISNTPKEQVGAVLAACAFGNSTGLPITLLTVIHENFPKTSNLGRIDPNLFLSVYLLLFPILQWGIGGWLLAPENAIREQDSNEEESYASENDEAPFFQVHAASHTPISNVQTAQSKSNIELASNHSGACLTLNLTSSPSKSLSYNVLNNKATESLYQYTRRGMTETDASLYLSVHEDLDRYGQVMERGEELTSSNVTVGSERAEAMSSLNTSSTMLQQRLRSEVSHKPAISEDTTHEIDDPDEELNSLLSSSPTQGISSVAHPRRSSSVATTSRTAHTDCDYEHVPMLVTLEKIASRALQPPVIGAILGILIAATPLRDIFVDTVDRDGDAHLEWLFDGLHEVGLAAVPLNMMILGCNLSASASRLGKHSRQTMSNEVQWTDSGTFSNATMAAIVIGKMLISPLIGFLSAILLQKCMLDVPDGT